MMKRALLLAVMAACDPMGDFEFDIDLSGLEPGPIHGEYDAVTFSLVDGCPNGNFLFGCPKTMPRFAVGSRARFVIGSVSGDPADDRRLASAQFVVSHPEVAAMGRDAEGFVVLESLAEGNALVEIDDEDGELIDMIHVNVEHIVSLKGDSATTILGGARVGASVAATGTSGGLLFARGAVVATLTGGLVLDEDSSVFFTGSDELAIRSIDLSPIPPLGETETPPTSATIAARGPGAGHITWTAGAVTATVDYTIVSRADITSAKVSELWHEPDAHKQWLHADSKVGETYVRGGPACDWRIVSGGGDGAAIASGVGDDTHSELAFFDSALVYGAGAMTVECRVNDQVSGQYTVQLGP
jgi:hypothetical protein